MLYDIVLTRKDNQYLARVKDLINLFHCLLMIKPLRFLGRFALI